MRKIDWFLVTIPLFVAWGVDRLTKMWAMHLIGIQFYGPLGFVLHHNHGAMLGLFSETSPVIRVVSLSTGGAFLLFFFVIIQYLLPIKSLTLRSGLSVLLGGILGNVTDRILYGQVIDFILIGSPTKSSPAFNMGDALQWVGYAMVAVALIRESELLWPENESRRFHWVNLKFQLRYCLILVGIGSCFAAITAVYSYTFLRVTIIDFGGNNPKLLDSYLIPFLMSFLAVSSVFFATLFLIGRILSARIAGPLYAFEKFLEDLSAGRPRVLRLRAGDEFKHLEELALKLTHHLAKYAPDAEGNLTGPHLPLPTGSNTPLPLALSGKPSEKSPETSAMQTSEPAQGKTGT